MFVPFAGNCDNGSVNDVGNNGNLWSSSLNSKGVDNAFNLNVDDKGNANLDNDIRYFGFSVRGVLKIN